MAQQTVYHVVPNGDHWAVKKQGAEQASRVAPSRDEALEYAETFARRQAPSRVIVHRDDGTIEMQHTFDGALAPAGRGWADVLTSPPVLTGIALALIAGAVTWFVLGDD